MSDKTAVFLYGTLRDEALREAVFGEPVPVRPAHLANAATLSVAAGAYPVLGPGDGASGLIADLTHVALDRGDWYEGLFGYGRVTVTVASETGDAEAIIWCPASDIAHDGVPWRLDDWQERFGPVARATAREVMVLRGQRPDTEIARRWKQIAARAQARLNAEAEMPRATLRRAATPQDVFIEAARVPYANFFSVEEYDLHHALFAGGRSDRVTRAAFISADAVVVLPYDPVRDHVLLIEQFRPGPLARGDRNPWSLEAIAGRIDGGETPESTAYREAKEEAGLDLGLLIAIGGHYPSPGAKAEYLHEFLALADLPVSAAGLGGLESEHEDIRAHVIPFSRLMDLVESGEVNNGPLILAAYALERRRPALRADAGMAGVPHGSGAG